MLLFGKIMVNLEDNLLLMLDAVLLFQRMFAQDARILDSFRAKCLVAWCPLEPFIGAGVL